MTRSSKVDLAVESATYRPAEGDKCKVIRRRRELSCSYVPLQRQDALRRGSGRVIRQGSIQGWSEGMARRLRRFVDNFRLNFRAMITLTYGAEYPNSGKTVKSHLRAFLERLRRTGYAEQGDAAVWFLEFQARGAPHFHLLTTAFIPKESIARWWSEISGAPEESSTRVEGLRDADSAGAYARKYASKADQKDVPTAFKDVGRFWGCFNARPRGEAPHQVEPGTLGEELTKQGRLATPVPRMSATIQGPSVSLLQRLIENKGYDLRVFETLTGFIAYGNEKEIARAWHYLAAVQRSADRTGAILGSSRRKMWAESLATR